MPSIVRQPRIRLATKTWLASMLVLLAALSATGGIAYHAIMREARESDADRLDLATRTVTTSLERLQPRNVESLPTAEVLQRAVPAGAAAWVLPASGDRVLASWPLEGPPTWEDDLPARVRTAGGGTGFLQLGADRLKARGILLRGGANRILGVLVVAVTATPAEAARAKRVRSLLAGLGSTALFGALLLLLAARRLARPLPGLMEASRRLGLGDLDHRAPVRTRDELGVLALTLNDAAATLKRSRAQLEQAGRIQAWHQVARQVAHEIKNPLAGMRVASENLHRASDRDPDTLRAAAREASEVVGEEVASLTRLADAFSSLARLPEPQPTLVDLNHVALHAVALASAEGSAEPGSGLRILTDLDDALPAVRADETQIGQVLKNLLKNATEAVGESGGSITVSTRREGEDVVLCVEDNGPGIPAEDRETVFEPFITTKDGGSGIGLALSRQIAEAHGGSLDAGESSEGGAALVLRLPAGEEEMHG